MRWTWALSAVLMLIPAVLMLLPAQATRDFAFVEYRWGTNVVDSRQVLNKSESNPQLHVLKLDVEDRAAIASASLLEIRVTADRQGVQLQRAALAIGIDCRFDLAGPQELVGDGRVVLRRHGACAEDVKKSYSVGILTAEIEGSAQLGLQTITFQAGSPYYGALAVVVKRARIYLQGSYQVDSTASMSRLELLAHSWQFGDTGFELIAAILLFCYILLLVGWRLMTVGRFSLGGSACFAGLAFTYAVLVPPFQAPDEPDHFLTMANLANAPLLAKKALELANKGQFERIKFRPEQKFTVADVALDQKLRWADHVVPTPKGRSYLAETFWTAFGGKIRDAEASTALLLMRFADTLLATLALFLGLCLLTRETRGSGDSTLLKAFLTGIFSLSILPFFVMHVSNHVIIIAGYLLQASLLPVVLSDRPLSKVAAASLGAGIAISLAGGRAGLLTPIFWAPLLLAHFIFTGSDSTRSPTKLVGTIYRRIGCIALGMVGVLALGHLITGTGLSEDPLVADLTLNAEGIGIWVALAATAFFLGLPLLSSFGRPKWTLPPSLVGLSRITLAALYLHSAFGIHHDVPNLEVAVHFGLRMSEYVRSVEQAFLLFVGLGAPDGYIVRTFFGGFGWLEFPISDIAIALIRALPTLGIAATFFGWGRGKYEARPGIAGICLLALCIYLASLAAGSYHLSNNLHGRYLCGFYIFYQVFGMTLWFRAFRPKGAWLVPALSGLHAYCLAHVILRYF